METSETKSELQKLKDSCKEKYKYWEGMVRDLWKNYSINDDLAEYEGAVSYTHLTLPTKA